MNPISTQNLENLPDVNGLRKLLQSLAVLDLIICPEWEDRYYSYNSKWSEDEEMGSMRNGCGDDFFALFNPSGCFFKGFAHEYPMSSWKTDEQKPWPGILDSVPEEFSEAKSEPAFSMDSISFCIWRLYSDNSWSHGPVTFPDATDPDGSQFLLECLDRSPNSYKKYAEEYFEIDVPITIIEHVYNHLPITNEIVSTLNSDISLSDIKEDLIEVGYPIE